MRVEQGDLGALLSGCGRSSCRAVALLPEGAVVTLAATPAPGFAFTGWGGDTDCFDGVVTLTESRVCTATFASQTAVLEVPAVGPLGLGLLSLLLLTLGLWFLRR